MIKSMFFEISSKNCPNNSLKHDVIEEYLGLFNF